MSKIVGFFSFFLISSLVCQSFSSECQKGEYVVIKWERTKKWHIRKSKIIECRECESGYFCFNGVKKSCPERYYCDEDGMSKAKECIPGYYCTGGSEKTTCKSLDFCPYSKMSKPLKIDEVSNDHNAIAKCPDSPPGFYCEGNVMKMCGEGYHCKSCGIEKTKIENYKCRPGYYCPGVEFAFSGQGNPKHGERLEKTCAYGSYCPENLYEIQCPPGYYCPERGMSEPKECESGYFCDSYGMINPKKCTGKKYCPYKRTIQRLSCDPRCGHSNGKECSSEIEREEHLLDGDFGGGIEGGGTLFWAVYGVVAAMRFALGMTDNVVKVVFNRLLFMVLLLMLGFLSVILFVLGVIALFVSLLPGIAHLIPVLGGWVGDGKYILKVGIFLIIGGFISISFAVFSLTTHESEFVPQTTNLEPSYVFIDQKSLAVNGDQCFNLNITMKFYPDDRIANNSQKIVINGFEGNDMYEKKIMLINEEINANEGVELKFYLKAAFEPNLVDLSDILDVSFLPVEHGYGYTDCTIPSYFVSTETPAIRLKFIDVVREYITRRLLEKKFSIGVVGPRGAGKSTLISWFISLLKGHPFLLKTVRDGDKHNTQRIQEFTYLEKNLVFVDSFGLDEFQKNYMKNLDLKKYDVAEEKIEFQTKFGKVIMGAFMRMFHLGMLPSNYHKDKDFGMVILKETSSIQKIVEKKIDFQDSVTEVVGIFEKKGKLVPEQERSPLDCVVFVTKNAVMSKGFKKLEEEHRDYMMKNDELFGDSRFFRFQREDLCNIETVEDDSLAPQEIFEGKLAYLFIASGKSGKNVFEIDKNAAIVIEDWITLVNDDSSVIDKDINNEGCFSNEEMEKYSIRKIPGTFFDGYERFDWVKFSSTVITLGFVLLCFAALGVVMMVAFCYICCSKKKKDSPKEEEEREESEEEEEESEESEDEEEESEESEVDEEESEESEEEEEEETVSDCEKPGREGGLRKRKKTKKRKRKPKKKNSI